MSLDRTLYPCPVCGRRYTSRRQARACEDDHARGGGRS